MTDPATHLTRRHFLGLSLGAYLGLRLSGGIPRLFGQEEDSAVPRLRGEQKAEHLVILWMAGGMSQTDTFDPKPGTKEAGPLKAIRTAVPDLRFSELLPRLAEQARGLAVLRSMATREGAHERARYLLHTGYMPSGTVHHPDLGAQISRALHDPELDLPAYVCISGTPIGRGFLEVDYSPFVVPDPREKVEDLTYPEGVNADRFARRRRMLEAIERRFKRDHPGDETEGHTKVYTKADLLMHSSGVAAFDLTQEPARLRESYGTNRFGQGCLMARRLLQRGVKVVEVQLGGWDTHQDNFTRNRELAGQLDAGFSALLLDLKNKGLVRKTLVVCMTEFGRTPQVNDTEGRDHWANGWSVALAGGPVQGGRAIGATSGDGRKVAERPLSAPDLHASIHHALGLDLSEELYTPLGRPLRVVDASGKVIPELFAG